MNTIQIFYKDKMQAEGSQERVKGQVVIQRKNESIERAASRQAIAFIKEENYQADMEGRFEIEEVILTATIM